MPAARPPLDLGPIDRLLELADTLAGAWGARALTCTTRGQERAMLRMFGVAGIDRTGRPLAAEVVERFIGDRLDRLAGGVSLPFAAALVEYDLTAQELALDIASGAVDLALEAEVLRDPGRRAAAEEAARRLTAAGLERIDANRTARLELLDLIGDAERPWLGTALRAPGAPTAIGEVAALVEGGVDVVQVSVPAVRELAEWLHDEGTDVPYWRPRPGPGSPVPTDPEEQAPSGSQRGLAAIRQALDGAAAERRAYARLATVCLPLAAPEQALVAAFERVDLVVADAMAEIFDGNVDPDRALADQAHAHRLLARSGASVLIGAGPLVVAPDLARGVPSSGATRAGRALALQVVGAALARRDGIPAERLLLGALPAWLIDERDPTAAAIAQVAVRAAIFDGHSLSFAEPQPAGRSAERWPPILAALLPLAPSTGLIVRTARAGSGSGTDAGAGGPGATGAGEIDGLARSTRAVVAVAREVAASIGPLAPLGAALAFAQDTVAAALVTLERLASEGWPSLVGEWPGGAARDRLGSDGVVERTDTFDPFVPAADAGSSSRASGPR